MLEKYIPADVPVDKRKEFLATLEEVTNGSGRLMLFAGDQKVEHLNNDFYGKDIPLEDNDPEHLFKIASKAKIGVFATQFGLISRYGVDYPNIPYLVKLNSKTNLIPYSAKDPYSEQWLSVEDVIEFKNYSGLNIKGVGYTVYLGSEHEHSMLKEAANIVHKAHKAGMLAVLWMYPKGNFVKDEHDPHLIAGAAGVAVCLGADFAKVKVPYKNGKFDPTLLKEATTAAGRCGVLCEGGKKIDEAEFLRELYEQIHIGKTRGNGTGRNIHQRPLNEAIKMANAIYAITSENKNLEEALEILTS
ncbi:aldolase [Caminibacter pacificus]|uniref:fructose-bisphosphate aldolase n=1 Tax=Caminibacter pacificus TaxID=1424653 RepID=A0AAJ4REE2_9BACT|nr:aldolase [Caminibacter pacificus]QCI28250.1 aldolase [Caminibacter pacificus]ROR41036.1 class I fructose-bisphosphate aldolase/fructose-bisphosphate aldolase/6-deoxy-5-ketofructose 1-phosphate synthase [Caminibacter pacificus]